MKEMFRIFAALFLSAALTSAATTPATAPTSVRGILKKAEGKPAVETTDHKIIYLEGDDQTVAVLNDSRLAGMDFEAVGHFKSPDHFQIDPITSRALFIHKDGKRLMITYWCDTCYIRTYSPGPCWCCQKYTDLDLREPDADSSQH